MNYNSWILLSWFKLKPTIDKEYTFTKKLNHSKNFSIQLIFDNFNFSHSYDNNCRCKEHFHFSSLSSKTSLKIQWIAALIWLACDSYFAVSLATLNRFFILCGEHQSNWVWELFQACFLWLKSEEDKSPLIFSLYGNWKVIRLLQSLSVRINLVLTKVYLIRFYIVHFQSNQLGRLQSFDCKAMKSGF